MWSLLLVISAYAAAPQPGEAILVSGDCQRVGEFSQEPWNVQELNILLSKVESVPKVWVVEGEALFSGIKVRVRCRLPQEQRTPAQEAGFKFYTWTDEDRP